MMEGVEGFWRERNGYSMHRAEGCLKREIQQWKG